MQAWEKFDEVMRQLQLSDEEENSKTEGMNMNIEKEEL